MDSRQQKKVALLHDYQAVFETEAGHRVLMHLMEITGFTDTSFHIDPHQAAFNEGRRSLVCDIISQLKWDIAKVKAELTKEQEVDEYIE